ncbi:sodium- and chloride-dependent betaine transporter-like [Styela clava]
MEEPVCTMDVEEKPKFETDNAEQSRKSSRITWNNKFEFIFNVVGYNVGLGNVWRFTYLCFKNGGGAFLIPYLIVAVFCGVPMMFMEVAIGQMTKRGCIAGIDNMVPLMRGVGYSSILLTSYYLVYIALVVAWCIIYLFRSFTLGLLPWATCDNQWNTNACIPIIDEYGNKSHFLFSNSSNDVVDATNTSEPVLSTVEFFNNYILQRTDGITDMGSFSNWKIFGCFVAGWILIYICIVKGIRTTGKVAYLTVCLPYIGMFALLIRGITLDGASNGILYYVTPNITKLADPQVWLDAGSQVIYSLGLACGAVIGLGSYNKSNFDCYRSSYFFVLTCCGSSVFFGFVVFSFLGHMASEQGLDVQDVFEGGPGLVFQVLPAEFALLPGSQIWSTVFFIALLGLALDGSYEPLEGIITALADYYPSHFGHQGSHYWRIGLCLALLIVGLPQLFDGGIYIFEVINMYGGSGICILWVASIETMTISWIYGIDKFFDDVTSMIGYRPSILIRHCLKYVTPAICMMIFIAICSMYKPLEMGSYTYPWWADMIGWVISISVVASIPIIAIKALLEAEGTWKQKWNICITPRRETNLKMRNKFELDKFINEV